jgi:arginine decarboxylase
MKIDQSIAPFWQLLNNYIKLPRHGFHTPGHRGGFSLGDEWRNASLLQVDLTEISGLAWETALDEAQRLAADFYQAEMSFFLVQGATQGILGALLGCFQPGDSILVARNCHLSVLNGLILADLNPIYLPVDYLPGWGLPLGVDLEVLREALRTYPDCKGLIVTNPTYQGLAGRVTAYRECLGERLLIVDEAHGGYLEWSGLAGREAYLAADVWIQGTHKILGSVTQTGILHLKSDRIMPEKVRQGLGLITTTSPSFILLAALDANRRFLATGGRELFARQLPQLAEVRATLRTLEGLQLLTAADLPSGSDYGVDPWKLTISGRQRGLTGFQIETFFQQRRQIQVEYADLHQATCFIAPWQAPADLAALNRAVRELAGQSGQVREEFRVTWPQQAISRPVLNPRAASLAPAQAVPLSKAAGRIAAGWVALYPPGIPLWTPGEIITAAALVGVETLLGQGGTVRGIDPGRRLIQCVED